ncbi:hypothetical protein ACQP00_39135 [Dactylosporangium sp. CS-047395]|uniref:hypothetical protein n=1 Tax=Dactylosporangium sp. CS-047395 TaxID=3239936 RepID=UPI003D924F2A
MTTLDTAAHLAPRLTTLDTAAVERLVRPGLRWLYALVLLDLAGAGAGAGQALYTAYDLGHYADAANCLRSAGLALADPARRVGEFAACTGAYNRGQGLAMLTGAVAMPLLAGLLMVLGALVAARRARPTTVTGPAVAAVATRFASWCRVMGLDGPRGPLLVVARPGRHAQGAYTTALPWGRPRVVVPLGYSYVRQDELDLILLHELAHVRMRDITWAAATWWTGWLSVPVLLAAFGPLVLRPSLWGPRVVTAVLLAALLSAITLLLRAAVLRRRECLADRYAVIRGDCLAALRTAAGPARGRTSWFAGHLQGPARVAAAAPADMRTSSGGAVAAGSGVSWFAGGLRGRARVVAAASVDARALSGGRVVAAPVADARWEGGWIVAVAGGLWWMFALQAAQTVLTDLVGFGDVDARLVPSLALAGAALGWAATMVPLWSRTPGSAWARAAGATAGLVAGFFLQPPGTLVPIGATLAGGHLLTAVPLTAAALAGATLLTALLARAAVVGGVVSAARGRVATGAAIVGAGAALFTATDTVWTVLREHWQFDSGAVDRHMFIGYGGYWFAAWTPGLIVVACLVVALAARVPLRREIPVVLAGAVGGGAVGVVVAQLRIGQADADGAVLHLLYDRWWICALAGWGVTLVGLARHRFLPAALVAGVVAAGLAGLVQYGRDVLTGPTGHGAHNLAGFVRGPVWLLCCAVLLTLPLAAIPVLPRVRWAIAPVAVLAVALGWLAPVTGREDDLGAFLATKGLPAGWTRVPDSDSGPDTGVQPEVCARRWADDRAAEDARAAVAEETATAEEPIARLRLALTLRSYRDPAAPQAVLDETAEDLLVCPKWMADYPAADDGRIAVEAVRGSELPGGYLVRVALTFRYRGQTLRASMVLAGLVAGGDVVTASLAVPLPPDTVQWRDAETIATAAIRRVLP